MHLYLACFDISDDRNRHRAGKQLLRHGQRVQESVFEIMIKSANEIDSLRDRLEPLIEEGDDLRFYHICGQCRHRSLNHQGDKIAEYPAATII